MEPDPSIEDDQGLDLVVPIGFSLEQLTAEETRLIKQLGKFQDSARTISEQLEAAPKGTDQSEKLLRVFFANLFQAARVNDKELQRKKRELHDLRQMIRHLEQKNAKQQKKAPKNLRSKTKKKVLLVLTAA